MKIQACGDPEGEEDCDEEAESGTGMWNLGWEDGDEVWGLRVEQEAKG